MGIPLAEPLLSIDQLCYLEGIINKPQFSPFSGLLPDPRVGEQALEQSKIPVCDPVQCDYIMGVQDKFRLQPDLEQFLFKPADKGDDFEGCLPQELQFFQLFSAEIFPQLLVYPVKTLFLQKVPGILIDEEIHFSLLFKQGNGMFNCRSGYLYPFLF